MFTSTPTVVLTDTSFAWPDGNQVLHHVTAAFGLGRTGIIGDNGSGKTTLLRLIAAELQPTTGTVRISGDVGYLPQHLTLQTDATIADLIGIAEPLDALRAIESGQIDPGLFDLVDNNWDIEARAVALLDELGLPGASLDRPVGQLSGGETMLVALAGRRLAGTEVVLLDEPTNNLDRVARRRFYDVVTGWRGALVVVTHDRALLDLMDDTAELRVGRLTVFGGPWSEFSEALAVEQEAAQQALRTAEQAFKKEQRQRRDAETRLARRQRYARNDRENKRKPKSVMNTRRFQAEVSAGKLRDNLDDRVETARSLVSEQERRLHGDARVRITLPDPEVPMGRRLAELHHPEGVCVIQGPERVALVGPNGVGKTRLIETLFTADPTPPLHATPLTRRIGYLPQRLDGLDDDGTALESVRAAATQSTPREIRAQLARFLMGSEDVDRPVATLSGGQRFRVALARLLLAEPAHQLLVLDEPTNNLDFTTVESLVDALSAYRGGLLVVSHDADFLGRLGIDTWLTIPGPDRLTH